ncbi:MAG: hypothetical protein K2O84_06715 [Oscillospiraceae bacterium]|nr:hypothetical protein [Oscillospiraceae bacterium]
MASFGAKNPYFAPIKSEPEGKLPVYDGEPVKIGRLVKADLTLTMASGKLYADDELSESADEFVSGSIAMDTDDVLDTVASVIYGATVKEKTVVYNISDNPPPGGLAYYKKLMRRGNLVFKGYFYPRVKAALGNDTAQTKTDSITFGTSSTTFTVSNANNRDWRHTEEFDKEADALAWVKAMLTSTDAEDSSPSGSPDSSGSETVEV